jgi:CRP-like cAMP-binding protein
MSSGTTGAMVETEILEIPLFAQITPKAAELVAAGGVTDVPAGLVLAQAGDHGVGMFVVLDGSVVVERGNLHVEIDREGFFGELALLVPDSPRIARVRAKTDARILAVPRETFDFLLDTEPTFTRGLLRELAARLVLARTGH